MKTFAVDEQSVSGYIYHKLMGHEAALPNTLRNALPKRSCTLGLYPAGNEADLLPLTESLPPICLISITLKSSPSKAYFRSLSV